MTGTWPFLCELHFRLVHFCAQAGDGDAAGTPKADSRNELTGLKKILELGFWDSDLVEFPPLELLQGLEVLVICAPNNISWALDTPRVCPLLLITLGLAGQ